MAMETSASTAVASMAPSRTFQEQALGSPREGRMGCHVGVARLGTVMAPIYSLQSSMVTKLAFDIGPVEEPAIS